MPPVVEALRERLRRTPIGFRARLRRTPIEFRAHYLMFSFFIANGFPICLSDRKQANDGSTPRLCLSSVEIKGGNVRVRGVNRIDRGHTTFFLIAALAGLLTSCDRDGDPIRAALAERESSWAR